MCWIECISGGLMWRNCGCDLSNEILDEEVFSWNKNANNNGVPDGTSKYSLKSIRWNYVVLDIYKLFFTKYNFMVVWRFSLIIFVLYLYLLKFGWCVLSSMLVYPKMSSITHARLLYLCILLFVAFIEINLWTNEHKLCWQTPPRLLWRATEILGEDLYSRRR